MTDIERRNAWLLAHPEPGYMPTREEVNAWWDSRECEIPPAAFLGGQGRSDDEVRESGSAVAGALASAFFLMIWFTVLFILIGIVFILIGIISGGFR